MTTSKWSRRFWSDLAERVGATFLGALLSLIVMDNVLEGPDWDTTLWPIVVLPTAVSLIKGLLANLANSESGASLLPAPPGPDIDGPEHQPVTQGHSQLPPNYEPPQFPRNERGESALGIALLVLVVVVIVVLLVRFL